MKFTRLAIPDIILCEPQVNGDHRGYFMESFRQDQLDSFLGFSINFCQDNESKSSYGVLRGLHYQLEPYAQTKLVRVIQGSVLDVVVDIRKGSPTFGEYITIKLSAENKNQLFVPRGFAHGFVVLSEEATFIYKVDNLYSKENERGIIYDDINLQIDWQINFDDIKLSKKDLNLSLFDEAEYFNYSKNLYD